MFNARSKKLCAYASSSLTRVAETEEADLVQLKRAMASHWRQAEASSPLRSRRDASERETEAADTDLGYEALGVEFVMFVALYCGDVF